jgi:hypothetical protein
MFAWCKLPRACGQRIVVGTAGDNQMKRRFVTPVVGSHLIQPPHLPVDQTNSSKTSSQDCASATFSAGNTEVAFCEEVLA